MEFKSNFERYQATDRIALSEQQRFELREILEDELIDLPDRFCQLRKAAGFSQVEFAAVLNVTQSAVSQWENGAKKPSAEVLIRLADLYDFDLKEFLSAFGFTFRK